MARHVSVAQAKAHLSALLAEVAFGGQRYVIERHGKPVAGLVGVDEIERLEQDQPAPSASQGFLALVGAWRAVPDAEIDALLAEIYAERSRDTGRPVELLL